MKSQEIVTANVKALECKDLALTLALQAFRKRLRHLMFPFSVYLYHSKGSLDMVKCCSSTESVLRKIL